MQSVIQLIRNGGLFSMVGLLTGTVLLLLLSPAVRPGPRWTQAELDKGYVVFQHSTLEILLPGRAWSNYEWLKTLRDLPYPPSQRPPGGRGPEFAPDRTAITGTVSCALARGEYKSVQIGIHALGRDLSNVRLELESDLDAKVYRPIDWETRQLLLGYQNPVWPHLHDACLDESSTIGSMEKGTTSFFWVTLHAPTTAAAGKHHGRIRIQPAGGAVTELNLEVTVRSFELQRARIAYAPFFYVEWGEKTGLPKFAQSDQWIEAIFRDMAEHSHTSVIGLGEGDPGAAIDFSTIPPKANRTFSFLLPLAQKVKLTSPEIPVFHFNHNLKSAWGNPATTAANEGRIGVRAQNEAMQWYEAERLRRGWPELIAYGHDEPGYPNPEVRKRFEPVRDVQMRLGTAMFAPAVYGLGDIHDVWIVRGGEVTTEMCAEARRLGAEVWTYICDAMSNKPQDERQYAGLYVWAYGLTGHTTWHYYAQERFKLVWFREGDKRPMPTVGWETRREGIDDYRYLQMLEDCVAAKPNDPVADAARTWMAGLRAQIIAADPHTISLPGELLPLDEYDRIREKAAGYIERLGPVRASRRPPARRTRLKDEAASFRGRSLQACIAGLEAKEPSVRRAAAWALFERGPEAAPAVRALANLLGEDDTRMPALRALEAIGPAGRSALPELRALLKHSDGFVRVGASYAVRAVEAR